MNFRRQLAARLSARAPSLLLPLVLALLPALLLALFLGACAETRFTWRADITPAPLPPDTPVRLYARSGLAAELRKVLAARGAETVVAFPDGERVAEIEALDSIWLTWDTVLDSVYTQARSAGADIAVATGGVRGPWDGVLYVQLLRSERLRRRDDAP